MTPLPTDSIAAPGGLVLAFAIITIIIYFKDQIYAFLGSLLDRRDSDNDEDEQSLLQSQPRQTLQLQPPKQITPKRNKKEKHRSTSICDQSGVELDVVELDDDLFKQPPPDDECPICFLPLSHGVQLAFQDCCGKTLCGGCVFADSLNSQPPYPCAFCRAPMSISDEDVVKRVNKLVDAKNRDAYRILARCYLHGIKGIPQDFEKAVELLIHGGKLGSIFCYYELSNCYQTGQGVNKNMKKAKHFMELAAKGGLAIARYNLGCFEWQEGNTNQAMKHWLIAASAGHDKALENVKRVYTAKGTFATEDQFEKASCAHKSAKDEMTSDNRRSAAAWSLSRMGGEQR